MPNTQEVRISSMFSCSLESLPCKRAGIIGRAVRTQSRGRVPAMVAAAWTESQPLGLIRFWGLWFLKGAVRIRGEGGAFRRRARVRTRNRSEEHTSELQSLLSNSYAVFCLKKNKNY